MQSGSLRREPRPNDCIHQTIVLVNLQDEPRLIVRFHRCSRNLFSTGRIRHLQTCSVSDPVETLAGCSLLRTFGAGGIHQSCGCSALPFIEPSAMGKGANRKIQDEGNGQEKHLSELHCPTYSFGGFVFILSRSSFYALKEFLNSFFNSRNAPSNVSALTMCRDKASSYPCRVLH